MTSVHAACDNAGKTFGLGDQIATCRKCRLSITRRPGQAYWADATGWEGCPKGGTHEPVPDGVPGAPVEMPGIPTNKHPDRSTVEALMTQLNAGAIAALDQWGAAGRTTVTDLVARAVEKLANGMSPDMLAHVIAHSAYDADPSRVASGLGWAIVLLAEQARKAAS